MELVDVINHVSAEELCVNEFPTVRRNSYVFPAVMICVLRVLLAHDDVLNSDSKFAILVVAWLV